MASLYVIKREAEAQGLSRKELSELSGVSQGTISSIFTGKTAPSDETLDKLTRAVFGTLNASDHAKDAEELFPKYSPHLVSEAAGVLGLRPLHLRKLIRDGEFAWAHVLKAGESRSLYMIDRQAFRQEYGVTLQIPRGKAG